MDNVTTATRALVSKALELYEDWIMLDKHGATLLQSLTGAIASVDDVNRGIESLYLAPPVVESYETNRSAVSVDHAIADLQDLAVSFQEVIAASLRLQSANLEMIQNMAMLPSDGTTLSPPEMSIFVDLVSSMLLKEYAVKEAIIQDLKLETSPSVLSTYLTVWTTRPHLDEIAVELMKERLAVHDQTVSKFA